MAEDRNADALTALITLAARLRDTAGAVAERADAAARNAARDDRAEPGKGNADPTWASADFGALIDLAAVLKESVPAELRDRLSTSFHDTLVSARALIDWYLEREAAAGNGSQGTGAADPDPVGDGGQGS